MTTVLADFTHAFGQSSFAARSSTSWRSNRTNEDSVEGGSGSRPSDVSLRQRSLLSLMPRASLLEDVPEHVDEAQAAAALGRAPKAEGKTRQVWGGAPTGRFLRMALPHGAHGDLSAWRVHVALAT